MYLPDAESDLDLCIFTANNTTRKRDLKKAMRKSISIASTFPVDLLLYNSEFYSRAGVACTIEHKIATERVAVNGQ